MIDLIPIQFGQHDELVIYVGTDEIPASLEGIRNIILSFGTVAVAAAAMQDRLFYAHVTSCRSRLTFSHETRPLPACGTTYETVVDDVRAILQEDRMMVVVRVGSDDQPATSFDIERVQDMLQSAPPTSIEPRVLVTHHAINIVSGGRW
jgi:hypothetical protein